MTATAGERLFARYAHAPNSLGYCGPAAASVLRAAACGRPATSDEVGRVARQFSGAWPYQQLIGELIGLDPLSEEVGRAYWTGSALTETVDNRRLGELLIERFAPQAGHYWSHLTPELLPEVTATHAFHVLGVYPWTRLLPVDAEAALSVLDGCRIRVGEIQAVRADRLTVAADALTWDGVRLALAPTRTEEVAFTVEEGSFVDGPQVGDLVAVHWGFACDRLSPDQAAILLRQTEHQLDLTNARLTR